MSDGEQTAPPKPVRCWASGEDFHIASTGSDHRRVYACNVCGREFGETEVIPLPNWGAKMHVHDAPTGATLPPKPPTADELRDAIQSLLELVHVTGDGSCVFCGALETMQHYDDCPVPSAASKLAAARIVKYETSWRIKR